MGERNKQSKTIKRIEHEAVVTEITPEVITVEFVKKSACSSCHAKSVCMASDESIRFIEIENTIQNYFEVGDMVNLVLKESMGLKAVWISYVIPLIILLLLLLSLSAITSNELVVGLGIVGAISLYYFIVYLFRDKIKKDFIFIIEKRHK